MNPKSLKTNKSSLIITLPHKHLRQRSKRIAFVTDETRALAEDMQQAVLEWEDKREHELGVALAGVQIDQLLRIVVVRNNFNDKADRSFQTLVNPKITKAYGQMFEDYEGCLSIKDTYGKVSRHEKVKVKALDLSGKEIRVNAEGFLARVLQHEIDHTNGILFIDHIKDNSKAFFHLTKEGKLEAQDYEQDIQKSNILW